MGPRETASRAALVLASVGITLLLLEGVARVVFHRAFSEGLTAGPPLLELTPRGPRLKPDARLEWYSPLARRKVHLATNPQGFRGPAIAPRKNRFRVLVLGDSIAFGPGLEEEETWPRRLEQDLGGRAEVINAGVPDLGTREELSLLAGEGLPLEPDLVVLAYYLNDSLPPYSFAEEYGNLEPERAGKITWLRQQSYLFRWIWERYLVTRYVKASGRGTGPWVRLFQQGRWREDHAVFDELVQKADSDFGAAWTEAGWKDLPGLLQKMKRLTESGKARLVVVCFPVSIQVRADFLDDRPQRRLEQICADLRLPCLDLLPALRARPSEALFLDQCHLTPPGAQTVADLTAQFLLEQRLVP